MATEKQIAANRNNAKRSTGPKTAAGKRRSSGNSYRHGLSVLNLRGSVAAESIDDIVCALIQEAGGDYEGVAAFVRAQMELRIIGGVRDDLVSDLMLEGLNAEKLSRVASLDRYDRLAQTKRRRALRSLSKRHHQRASE